MSDLQNLETKAQELAAKSTDAGSLLKATQALYTLMQSKSYKPTPVWPTVLTSITAAIAVVLTVVTIRNQGASTEDAQWTDTVKQIISKDSSVPLGVLGIQGFFDSDRHMKQSRQVASALLPLVDNKDIFQSVLNGLAEHTDSSNQADLVGVTKTVSSAEWDMFWAQSSEEGPAGCPKTDDKIVVFLNHTERCYPYESGEEPPKAKQAWLYSWEIDSLSAALDGLWHQKSAGLTPHGLDLSGIFLVNTDTGERFQGLDFSDAVLNGSLCHLCDLSGAKLDGAKLKGAVFHQIFSYQGSTWKDAHWWEAEAISCGLSQYLKKNYWPQDPQDQKKARSIVDNCRDDNQE